eukprot:1590186-Amphidinium_carterae.1
MEKRKPLSDRIDHRCLFDTIPWLWRGFVRRTRCGTLDHEGTPFATSLDPQSECVSTDRTAP